MGQKRALVVDDSKSARVILSRMLEKYDIEVDMAESAEQAIEYLRHDRPDAIFMDHLMPGMDGLQAVKTIKSNPQTAMIPIMMYTSQEGELYVGQARALGAMGVLPKQVRPVDVSKVLYELHLLPDRRDLAEPALVPVEIATEPGNDKNVTVITPPGSHAPQDWGRRVEAAIKQQSVDLRRFVVASLDSLAARLESDCAPRCRSGPRADTGGAAAPAPPLGVAVDIRSGRLLSSGGALDVPVEVDPRRSRQGTCGARRAEGRRRRAQANERPSRRLDQGSLGRRRRRGHAGLGAGLECARRGGRLAAIGAGSLRRIAFRPQPPGCAARRAGKTGSAEFPGGAQGHQFARHVLPGRQCLGWIRTCARRIAREQMRSRRESLRGIPLRASNANRSRSRIWSRASSQRTSGAITVAVENAASARAAVPYPRAEPIHSPPANGTGRRRPIIAWSTPRSPPLGARGSSPRTQP